MMIFFDFVGGSGTSHADVVGHTVGGGANGVVIKVSVMGERTEMVVGVKRLMLEFRAVGLIVVLEKMFPFIGSLMI